MSIKIIGLGSYLPSAVLTNNEISKKIPTSDEWIIQNLGIHERRIAEENEFSSDLAKKSSILAIKDANINPEDIDFIIFVTSTPDRISPSTACILQEKIGAFKAACVDINAVCCGFLYGLQIAKGLLAINQYKTILLVSSETYSKITDWNKRDCVFFGDGSGAVVLKSDQQNLCEIDLYSDGTGKDIFTVHHGKKFLMNGSEVYNNATSKLPESIVNLLKRLNIDKNNINHIIPHQAGIRILKKTAEILNINFSKFYLSMDRYANTAGASIPVTLDKVYKENKLNKNDIILFTSIGSGWVWGSALIKWTKS